MKMAAFYISFGRRQKKERGSFLFFPRSSRRNPTRENVIVPTRHPVTSEPVKKSFLSMLKFLHTSFHVHLASIEEVRKNQIERGKFQPTDMEVRDGR